MSDANSTAGVYQQRWRRHFKSGQATANKRSLVHVHRRGGGGVYNRPKCRVMVTFAYLELLMGRNYASLTLSYSWEGFMQNMPPVTLGKELCKTYFA